MYDFNGPMRTSISAKQLPRHNIYSIFKYLNFNIFDFGLSNLIDRM